MLHGLSWLNKIQKPMVTSVNDDHKCFQYPAIAALNHKNLENILKEYCIFNLL